MKIENRVRRIYERRPYPPPSLRERRLKWPFPPLEWIDAVRGRFPVRPPGRILVAGCGVGTEAFAVAKEFPAAEVVGVDFSARSIATARKLKRSSPHGSRIRFEIGDLAEPGLTRIVGDSFDLVTCHGVLSYIPEPVRVLRNFARLLTPTGSLYLGVNGAAHPSRRLRHILPILGFEVEEFRESEKLREVLQVCQSLSNLPFPVAKMLAGVLAGDLFGPLNQSLRLTEWKRLWSDARLYLHGSYRTYFVTRALFNQDLYRTVMPRSRAELAELSDALEPASFHQLILSREAPVEIPWNDGKKLMRLRPMLTGLHKIQWPARGGPWQHLREVSMQSRPTNTKASLRVPQWEIEILKKSDGTRSLRKILEPVKPAVPSRTVSEGMYVLYHLGAINLLPEAQQSHLRPNVED